MKNEEQSLDKLEKIRLPEVLKIAGVCKKTIYEWMRLGKFPRQVQLGDNSVGWYLWEVLEWDRAREKKRLKKIA